LHRFQLLQDDCRSRLVLSSPLFDPYLLTYTSCVDRDTRSYEKWYHLASWGTPAVLVAIVGGLGHYGRLRGAFFCYINQTNATLVAFFVPGLLIVSANSILFVFVAREIRETLKGAADIRGGDKKDVRRQLRVYISIVFSIGLSWIFGFISLLFASPEPEIINGASLAV